MSLKNKWDVGKEYLQVRLGIIRLKVWFSEHGDKMSHSSCAEKGNQPSWSEWSWLQSASVKLLFMDFMGLSWQYFILQPSESSWLSSTCVWTLYTDCMGINTYWVDVKNMLFLWRLKVAIILFSLHFDILSVLLYLMNGYFDKSLVFQRHLPSLQHLPFIEIQFEPVKPRRS